MSLFGSLIKTALAKGASNVVDSATPTLTQRVRAQLGGVPAKAKNELIDKLDETNPTLYTGTSKDKDFKYFKDSPRGTWFTKDPETASMYAADNESKRLVRDESFGAKTWDMKEINTADRVIPVKVDMQNPKTYTGEEYSQIQRALDPNQTTNGYKAAERKLFYDLRNEGYDSVIIGEGKDAFYVALGNPKKQIKPLYSKEFEEENILTADTMVADNKRVLQEGYYNKDYELRDELEITFGEDPRMAKGFKIKSGDRVSQLQDSAKRIEKFPNSLSLKSFHQKLVNSFKPIWPYTKENIPKPETMKQMKKALSVEKKEKLLKSQTEIKEGTDVDVRLDIPAYLKKILEDRAWIPTIKKTGEKGTFHTSTARMTNVTFDSKQKTMLRVATGKQSKTPAAVMKGKWKTTSNGKNYKDMQKFFDDPEWTQIGFDPERHSYFYNRVNQLPAISADEVIQVGPLVLAKNVVYGKKKDFLYSIAPLIGGGAALGAATDAALKSSDTKSKEPDAI